MKSIEETRPSASRLIPAFALLALLGCARPSNPPETAVPLGEASITALEDTIGENALKLGQTVTLTETAWKYGERPPNAEIEKMRAMLHGQVDEMCNAMQQLPPKDPGEGGTALEDGSQLLLKTFSP